MQKLPRPDGDEAGVAAIAAPVRRLRILSFNIQAGNATRRYRDYVTHSWKHVWPDSGKQRNLAALVPWLEDYDLVGLQEADGGSLRSGFLNQARYLAETAAFPFWTQQGNRRVGPIAHSTNCLLSRLPIGDAEDHPLPGRIRGRGALLARVGEGEHSLAVIIAHLSLGPKSRKPQWDLISELVADAGKVVLMGDFNCAPEDRDFAAFRERSGLRHADGCAPPTFPSWRPRRAIDHVLVSKDLQVDDCRALPLTLSDHLPVAVTVSI